MNLSTLVRHSVLRIGVGGPFPAHPQVRYGVEKMLIVRQNLLYFVIKLDISSSTTQKILYSIMPEGPRWVGDKKPDLPSELQHAQELPPLVTDKHVFFFGYEGEQPEVCLQQWYPSAFNDLDSEDEKTGKPLSFHTSEQYMMYFKALLMGDDTIAEKILASEGPGEAKALGRQVSNFDQGVWDANCDGVVERANLLKFSQDERLKGILLGTGDREIVETSPNDKVWGIGFDSEHAQGNEERWGENKLGKALMRVREHLKGELESPSVD